MSTWSPLAVMSYANSQLEPVQADFSLVHSEEETIVFQKKDYKKKKRCEKKKMLDLFCMIMIMIIIQMIMIINIYYD